MAGLSVLPRATSTKADAEPARLAALDSYDVLDTPREKDFDDVAALASAVCGTPIAVVNLIGEGRQFFKAEVGLGVRETPLDSSFCARAILEEEFLLIPDATKDPRFKCNPLVTDEPHLRFYAGALLKTDEGHAIGTVCVLDFQPRDLTDIQQQTLRVLARQVMKQLELRRALRDRDALIARQHTALRRERHLDILAEASVALLTASEPSRVIEPILATSATSLGFEQSYIYEVAPDARRLRLSRSIGASDEVRATLVDGDIDGPLCGLVVQTGRPLVLENVLASREPRYALAREIGINAFAGYPIQSRGRIIGVISFTATAQDTFDADALAFFATIARYLSAVRERLDAEAALRASDARSRLAQEAGRVGTYEVDVASGLMAVSPEFCRLFGLAASPFYSTDAVIARIVPEDAHLASSDASREAGAGPLEVTYRIRRANDGALRWLTRNASFVHDADGKPVRVFGTVQDVTDRQEAQQALRDSEAHWRGLFERLSEGFLVGEVVRDGEGRITDWRYIDVNAAWGALIGLDPARVVGRTLREVLPGVEDAWVDEFAGVVETGHPVAFTRRVGVLRRWYEGRAFPLGPERFGMIFLEVTARVEADVRRDALLELGERLRDLDDVPALVHAAAEIMARATDATRAGYGLVDVARETVEVLTDWHAPGTASVAGLHDFRAYGSYVEDLRRGEVVAIDDVTRDPRTQDTADALLAIGVRVLLNVPILERARLVGIAFVNWAQLHPFTADDLAFVRTVADRVQTAVARVRGEEQQALLNNELSHRLKNTLSMVQSIASQTLRDVSEREAVDAFGQRVLALSQAHDVLLQDKWTGAAMRTVVDSVLALHAPAERLTVEGSDLQLNSQAALSLSLLLHELATNAVKYGALSNAAGHVTIAWRVEAQSEPILVLDWQERGGPPAQAPTRRGFGSRLIQHGLVGTRDAMLCYSVSGLDAAFRAPLAHAVAS